MRLWPVVVQTSVCLMMFGWGNVRAQWLTKELCLTWTLISDTLAPIEATVPGNPLISLHRAGVIPDPAAPGNEDEIAWVGERSWVFRSGPFDGFGSMYEGAYDLFLLEFPGLAPFATVFLNGKEICRSDNAFVPAFAFVADELNAAGNDILEVHVESISRKGRELVERTHHPLPGDAYRAVVRMPQFQFGWDWAPRAVASSIGAKPNVRPVVGALIRTAGIRTVALTATEAMLEFRSDVWITDNGGRGRLQLFDESGNLLVELPFDAKTGEKTLQASFVLKQPKLWTTHERGTPHLYHFEARLMWDERLVDHRPVKFGIRSAGLVRKKDKGGESFFIELNGEEIFARGANYVPSRLFPELTTEAELRSILTAAKEANMNMVRVWGGGVYEQEAFYNLCDSLGLMVWQDFMFACAMYPGGRSFRDNVGREADYQTKRLGAHPSVVLWCGNNEVSEGWHRWGWQDGLKRSEKRKIQRSYQRIFHRTLPRAVSRNTGLPYVPSSPELGRGDPRHTTRGSAHNWWVWHDGAPFDNYQEQVPRFMSEFGYQSLPNEASLNKWLPEETLRWAAAPLSDLQRHGRGFAIIEKQLTDWHLKGKSMADTIYLSQMLQAEAMGTGIRAHRTGRPHCMGSLLWQLNDCAPAISWSLIDSEQNRKAAYYRVKRDLEPFNIMHLVRNDSLFLFLINDYLWEKDTRVLVSVETFDSEGTALNGRKLIPVSRGNEIRRIEALPISQYLPKRHPKECYAVISYTVEGRPELTREKAIFFGHPGEFPLSPPMLTVTSVREPDGRFKLTIQAVAPARMVEIKANAEGHFDDNYLDVVPGYPRTVYFTPKHAEVIPTFDLKSLWDAVGPK